MICARSIQRSTKPAFSRRSIASTASPKAPFLSSASSQRRDEPFRMLMLAKPGGGKGTLSGKLMDKYDIKFISTGDILRQHIKDKTDVGRAAEAIVAQGGLVPDDLMIKLLSTGLTNLKGKNWIIDGFPRTLGQGRLLDQYLDSTASPLSLVMHLDVPDEVILARIADRWIHPGSGRIYNYSYNRPKIDGLDDVTGEPLEKRPDDNPEIYARRLKSYYESTAPLIAYYKSHTPSKLVTLAGRTSDEIWPQLDAVVQSRFRLKPKKAVVPEAVVRRTVQQPANEVEDLGSMPIPAAA